MKILKLLLAPIGILMLTSCENDSTDDLIDPNDIPVARYGEHISPIISNNCMPCHSNPPQFNAPMHLTTYENVREAVENRGLVGRISSPEGAPGHMPNGGPRLPQNLIDLIIQWEDQGFQQ